MAVPKPGDMFGDANDSVEITDRFMEYKAALGEALNNPQPPPGAREMAGAPAQNDLLTLEKTLGSADVTKALSPELVESVRNSLAATDIVKDWTTANPLSTGLVAFDLEVPKLSWAAA